LVAIFLSTLFYGGCTALPEQGEYAIADTSLYVSPSDPITEAGENGIKLTGEAFSLRQELIRTEQALTDEERLAYYRARDFLHNDSERIYFLGLASPEEQERYLKSKLESRYFVKAVAERKVATSAMQEELLQTAEEIRVGMSKEEVRSHWGNPTMVDVAGDPREQNERWSFIVNNRAKTIYFEKGTVQGWELD